MGQYHIIVNLDKRQYLYAHKFGDGLKLLEFGASGSGTMLALAVLLAKDNGKGGGDLYTVKPEPLIGSWSGDRITIAGDYGDTLEGAEYDDLVDPNYTDGRKPNLYGLATLQFEDISDKVLGVLFQDKWVRQDLEASGVKDPTSLIVQKRTQRVVKT